MAHAGEALEHKAVFDAASSDQRLSPSADSKPESSSSPPKEPPSGVCRLKHHTNPSHALESVGPIVLGCDRHHSVTLVFSSLACDFKGKWPWPQPDGQEL